VSLEMSAIAPGRRGDAIATLVSAFSEDPVERWLYPETERYLADFPAFVAAFSGTSFDRKTAWCLGQCSAVALWLPPGEAADGDALLALLIDSVAPALHADLFSMLEQMDEGHPTFDHWYLPWLGVHAAEQGKGLGSQLLQSCLGVVDASHLPAYLETPNPRTIPLYERHGFVVTGVAQAGSCPPMTFMLRAAHPHG
jgi:GNAT superfamily N-acetyltransferase